MSNDFTPITPTDGDAPMFAPIPSWERGKKRRSFGSRGSRVAAEPRSFASDEAPIPTRPVTLSEDARAYEARMDTVDPTDTSFAAAPVYAGATARRNNGAAPIAIAAGIILLGGLAAAGWYAYQPHNTGVAELTPGAASTTTTTEVASAAPAAVEPQGAAAPADAPVATTHSTTVTTSTKAPKAAVSHTTVTRAAPARSAAQSGANASTTAAAPMPAPTPAAPPAAAPPAPLVLTIPPAQAAPTTAAPAEAPLPTQSAPAQAPTQTPPN